MERDVESNALPGEGGERLTDPERPEHWLDGSEKSAVTLMPDTVPAGMRLLVAETSSYGWVWPLRAYAGRQRLFCAV